MIISIQGPLGYETARRFYEENIVLLKKQFPLFFIKEFVKAGANIGSFDIEKTLPHVYISEISEGGLFAALWQLCQELGCGCEIFQDKIPVRQDVIEILEFFGESPYEVSSSGCFLIASEGLPEDAAFIGYTNKSKDRIVNCGDWKRFLTPKERQAKDTINRKGEIL